MKTLNGITYNIRGLMLGLKTPKLLILGLVRFTILILLTFASIGLVFLYQQDIMALIWIRPESYWILWLWHLVSWFVSLLLMMLSGVVAYLLAQILFCVFIMDIMSRTTERIITGHVQEPDPKPWMQLFLYLIRQEIPRAILPILLMLLLTALGWLTPLGPIITLVVPLIVVIFLAWDNSDLLPARRAESFKQRFRFLLKSLPFHLGFGLPFLIPILNSVVLSFAPVGATLYMIDNRKEDAAAPV